MKGEQDSGLVEEGQELPLPEEITFYSTTLYSTVDMDDDGLTALTLENDPEIKDLTVLSHRRSIVEDVDGDEVMVTASMQEELVGCEEQDKGCLDVDNDEKIDDDDDDNNNNDDEKVNDDDDEKDWMSLDEHLTTTVVPDDVQDADKTGWQQVDTFGLPEVSQRSLLLADV